MKKFFDFYHELERSRERVPVCELRANWKWGERWGREGIKVRGGINIAEIDDRLEKLDDENATFWVLKLSQIIVMNKPQLESLIYPVMNQLFVLNGRFTWSLVSLMRSGMERSGKLDIVVEFLDFVENTYSEIARETRKILEPLDQNLREEDIDNIFLEKLEKDLEFLHKRIGERIEVLKLEAEEFRSVVNLNK